jgi:hypothetical protein
VKIRAITTCSAAGWQQYGRRMAQSWAARWPVPLTLWTEGFACDVPGVEVDQLERIEWLAEFKRRHKHLPVANYRFDAVRFAHKTAAVIESALSFDCDWLIWVDADTVTHTKVPESFVQTLLPQGVEYIAWLDRVDNYPECGFYVLNMRHARHQGLMTGWREIYTGRGLFSLREWHDSYVLQQLIARAGVPTKSLSGERASRTGHPFINGPLGAYMDHLKGPRKVEGKSRRKDLKVFRPENYWRGAR